MSTWRAPTRASEMEAQAAEHLTRIFGDVPPRNARGQFIDASVVGSEGEAPREPCPGCGRLRPVFELVDARGIEAFPGDHACGACRGSLHRRGVVSRAAWVEMLGAPAEVVEKLRRVRGGENATE